MIIFKSLKEVSDFAHHLVMNHTAKDLKKINPEIIIDFTVGAKYHLAKLTKEFANRLALGNVSTTFEWPYYIRKYFAGCYVKKRHITYCLDAVILMCYDALIETIVHELTHLQVRRHNHKFWELVLINLKKLGIVEPSMSFDTFFVKQYDKSNYWAMGKTDTLLCHSIFRRQLFYNPYEVQIEDGVAALRGNRIFDIQACRQYRLRCPKKRYFEYIDSVEKAYLNYEEVTLICKNSTHKIYDSFRTDKIHSSCTVK